MQFRQNLDEFTSFFQNEICSECLSGGIYKRNYSFPLFSSNHVDQSQRNLIVWKGMEEDWAHYSMRVSHCNRPDSAESKNRRKNARNWFAVQNCARAPSSSVLHWSFAEIITFRSKINFKLLFWSSHKDIIVASRIHNKFGTKSILLFPM